MQTSFFLFSFFWSSPLGPGSGSGSSPGPGGSGSGGGGAGAGGDGGASSLGASPPGTSPWSFVSSSSSSLSPDGSSGSAFYLTLFEYDIDFIKFFVA